MLLRQQRHYRRRLHLWQYHTGMTVFGSSPRVPARGRRTPAGAAAQSITQNNQDNHFPLRANVFALHFSKNKKRKEGWCRKVDSASQNSVGFFLVDGGLQQTKKSKKKFVRQTQNFAQNKRLGQRIPHWNFTGLCTKYGDGTFRFLHPRLYLTCLLLAAQDF